MKQGYRSKLITSTSMLAIALSVPVSAWAEEAQTAQSSKIEEITVTARRVEENVQKVAVAVTVIPPDQLAAQNIVGLKDFQKVTTAFSVVTDTGIYAFMRGLQGIVTFFADAPYNLKSTGQLFDVGSVQVLKGPQGTLFGASSVSGVFVMNPQKPTNTFGGYAQAIVGDYGKRDVEGALNLPVVDDKLMFRLAAQSNYRKGYVTASDTGKSYFDQNFYVIRPSMIVKPTDSVENYTMVQYYYQRDNGRIDNLTNYDPHAAYGLYTTPGRADQLLALHLTNIYALSGMQLAQGFSGEKERQIEVVNNTHWDITDNLAFVNIFMWRTDGQRNVTDTINDGFTGVVSNDPRAIAARTAPLNMQKQWSDEAKVQGKLFDDLLNFTVGTFSSGNPAKGEPTYGDTLNNLVLSKTEGDIRDPAHVRAVFGQTDVDLGRVAAWADGLTFTAGIRYTWDTQIYSQTNYNIATPTPTISRYLYGHAKFSYDNWLFGLRYQYTPDTMFYVTGSKGVTTGQTNPQNPDPYKLTQPENLKQIEGGVKSTFYIGDIQARTNVAAYYGWYSNIQSTEILLAQVNPPPAPETTLVISANSAAGLVRGIDADFTVLPTDWFELGGNMSYNKNKYTNWPINDPATGAFLYNRTRPFIGDPKMKWNLTGTIHVPMDEKYGKMSISATYEHTSTGWYFANSSIGAAQEYQNFPHYTTISVANGYGPLASAIGGRAVTDHEDPYHNVDMDVKWQDPYGVKGLTATFAITNLLKNKNGYGTGWAWFAAGFVENDPTPPRMFTLSFKYSF